MALLLLQTKGLLSTRATCPVPLPGFNHNLQLSALTRPWGGFIRKGFQWQLLKLQDTLGFSSDLDFLKDCCYLLSASEDPGLNTKYTAGLIETKKGVMSHYLPIPFVKSSKLVQLIREV